MDSIKLWARDGEAVHQAIELGEIAHMETAREELTDAFLLFAIESGRLQTWAEAFPDPRSAPEIGMEGILPAPLAARFAGLYSMRKAGYVLRSARVLGALGYSVDKPRQRLLYVYASSAIPAHTSPPLLFVMSMGQFDHPFWFNARPMVTKIDAMSVSKQAHVRMGVDSTGDDWESPGLPTDISGKSVGFKRYRSSRWGETSQSHTTELPTTRA